MQNKFAGIFEVDSTSKTLVLCIVTIGAYLIYKLYRFSNQINNKTNFKISNFFVVVTIILFAISFSSLIYGLLNLDNPLILKSSIGIHVISTIFDVTWIIKVRNFINLIADSKKGDELWLNPYITSIFHVIYMQQKINKGLART